MINDNAAPLVIDIAKTFISVLMSIEPAWETGYFRFSAEEFVTEVKGSYVCPAGVKILNVLKLKDFFHPVAEKGRDLLAGLGKTKGVALLIVKSNFEYEIKFDFENLNRWNISKVDGGTGIPEGL